MPVYKTDIHIAGTLYVQAGTEQQALEKLKTLSQHWFTVGDSDIPVDNEGSFLSPAMTGHGLYDENTIEYDDETTKPA